VPKTILVQEEPEERPVLETWLQGMRGGRVSIQVPQRGAKRGLLQLAIKNAQLSLQTLLQSARVRQEMNLHLLQRLQEYLSLPASPTRIEAYDISTVQGVNTVGSMVTFREGVPDKKSYRMFKIKDPEAFRDDYAALREVLGRRFANAKEGLKGFAELPNLLLIDGGKGQLRAARKAMEEAGFQIPSISIAKKEEKIYTNLQGSGSRLFTEPDLLHLFQRVRDEAHRFALSYHVRLRAKGQVKSLLDQSPGVGPERRRRLMAHFRSLERLASASGDEIRQVPGIDSRTAEAITAFLRATSEDSREEKTRPGT
jgi:excinuclease ABC subunit C